MSEWMSMHAHIFELIYEIVFSLFAKSECCIEIIKHNWTEIFVFVEMS